MSNVITYNPEFKIIDSGDNTASQNLALCYQCQLIGEPVLIDPLSLFQGFDSIHAITFSYNLRTINNLMGQFKDGEIIIGASFLARKDLSLQNYEAAMLSNAEDAVKQLRSCDRLTELASDGNFAFRTPRQLLDHRKIYILHADDGRTRVIFSSANLSSTFITGDRMEHYEYDDSYLAYEWFMREFNTMWENSSPILDTMITGEETKSPVEGNPILKEAKELDKVVILKRPDEKPEDIELVRYDIEKQAADEKWSFLVNGTARENRSGLIKLTPRSLEKIEINQDRFSIRRKLHFIEKKENYPRMVIDIENGKVLINDQSLDLSPSSSDLHTEIELILELFDNFSDFIDTQHTLQLMHFKAMTMIFASPFFSILRCEIYLTQQRRTVPSLPLFLFETSSGSDCGKTFMLRVFLKMMSGMDLPAMNYDDMTQKCGTGKNKPYSSISDCLRTIMGNRYSLPFFIDEINSQTLTKSIQPLLKNAESCEKTDNVGQSLLIFASNKMSNPEETERKRAVWLEFNGGLPSSIDRAAYKCKGDALYRKCGTAFYREYLRRMITEVRKMMQFIHEEQSENWYPDLINVSSKIICDILTENGYMIPPYMGELSWYNDFNGNECAASTAINQIKEMYEQNRKAFSLSRDKVRIMLGSDSGSKKKLENWMRVLPNEMNPRNVSIRMDYQILLDRAELEKRLGFKLRKSPFSRYFRN